MKNLFQFLALLFFLIIIYSCEKLSDLSSSTSLVTSKNFSVRSVNVESFNLYATSEKYSASGIRSFNKDDNAIGDIKEMQVGNNGLLRGNDVIVFDNILPINILELSYTEINNLFDKTTWVKSTTYKLPIDVAVNSYDDELVFKFRTGETTRYEGKIDGKKAYKFQNNVLIENYRPFMESTDKGITDTTSLDLIKGFKIDKNDYEITSNSDAFIVKEGILTFHKSLNNQQNNFGLIYLKPKSDELPTYRLQMFNHIIPENLKNKYFDSNAKFLDKKKYYEQYFKQILNDNTPKLLFLKDFKDNSNFKNILDCSECGQCQRTPPPHSTTGQW